MTAERGSWSKPVELIPASKQHWVLLADVTCADVNTVLGIYEKVTKKPVPTVEEEEFEILRDKFIKGIGVEQLGITKQTHLEWRRTINPANGKIYVRFSFGGGGIHHVFNREPGVERTIRTRVDDYFQGRSTSLSKLNLSSKL